MLKRMGSSSLWKTEAMGRPLPIPLSAYTHIKITRLPAGAAEGASDLQNWSVRRSVGRSGVPDKNKVVTRVNG
jgi:hypothetical protein